MFAGVGIIGSLASILASILVPTAEETAAAANAAMTRTSGVRKRRCELRPRPERARVDPDRAGRAPGGRIRRRRRRPAAPGDGRAGGREHDPSRFAHRGCCTVSTLVRPPGRADHGRTAASEAADVEVAMAVDETPQPASVAGSTMTAVRQGLVPGWLDRLAAIGWRVLVVIALALVFVAPPATCRW